MPSFVDCPYNCHYDSLPFWVIHLDHPCWCCHWLPCSHLNWKWSFHSRFLCPLVSQEPSLSSNFEKVNRILNFFVDCPNNYHSLIDWFPAWNPWLFAKFPCFLIPLRALIHCFLDCPYNCHYDSFSFRLIHLDHACWCCHWLSCLHLNWKWSFHPRFWVIWSHRIHCDISHFTTSSVLFWRGMRDSICIWWNAIWNSCANSEQEWFYSRSSRFSQLDSTVSAQWWYEFAGQEFAKISTFCKVYSRSND
jgi:hypothetical protein